MPTLHSKLGASSAHRWLNCPGSIRLSEQVSGTRSSWWANQGTAAHAICEWALTNRKPPKHLQGYWVDSEERIFETRAEAEAGNAEHIFEVDEEMVRATTVFYDHVRGQVDTMELMGEEPALFIEQGFDLSFIMPGMFGTNDASVFSPGRTLKVSDYKHGAGKVVEVVDNPQLLYYALGALRQICWADHIDDWDERLMPDEIEITIVQPRARHPDGPIRSWKITPDYLVTDFAAMLQNGAKETQRPNAELRAGDWCQFCPAKTICPAYEDMIMTPAELTFSQEDIDDVFEPCKKDLEKRGRERGIQLAKEDPERLAQIIAMKPMFDSMVEAAEQQALQLAKSGDKVPNFKIVRKKKHRRWIDPKKVVDLLTLALKEEDLFERKMKSPAKLEAEGFAKVIDGLWEKPEGALTLVPETDTRPEVTVFDSGDAEL